MCCVYVCVCVCVCMCVYVHVCSVCMCCVYVCVCTCATDEMAIHLQYLVSVLLQGRQSAYIRLRVELYHLVSG